MRRIMLMLASVVCLIVLGAVLISRGISAQDVAGAVYNPYPPGILPPDLVPEIDRVNREVKLIEAEALAQWHALPINSGTAMRQVQILGKLELFDKNLSVNKNQACSFCHMPYAGFSGPIPSVNLTTVAYPGSSHFRFGKRKPQSYTYSPFFPVLQYTDAEQAQDPLRDPLEMGMPDSACIVRRLSLSAYRKLFETVWGPQAFVITWPADVDQICSTPAGAAVFGGNPNPVSLSPVDRGRSNATFGQYALAVTAYEGSPDVSAFSSKFDAFLAGKHTLTANEMAGYNLFRGKGNCNSCHVDGRSTTLTPGQTDDGKAADVAPKFTDTTTANLGLPKNPADPFYYETTPDSFGFTPNPAGFAFTDLGVGLFLRNLSGTTPNSDWAPLAPAFDGFMQTATARNVDMRPKCPNGKTFPKAYMHNGYLKSLKEVVHFYNTRDVYPFDVESGHCPAGTKEKVNCWPAPEVPQTKDMTIGKLGLTPTEEDQIVAFMKTLTDGFTTPYPDSNTFTGSCQ